VRDPLSRKFRGLCAPVLAAIVLAVIFAVPAPAFSGVEHCFSDSIKAIASDPNVRVTRQKLSASEHNEILQFSVSLKMPNFEELEARIGRGEQITHDVMEARYLPSASDCAAVENWLKGNGFTLTMEDPNHTNVFARGTVAQIENAMGVHFARVATADGEFTSAISAPNLPEELSGAVLTINGLQPHLRMHHQDVLQPDVTTISGVQYFEPADVLAAYNVPNTLNGAGQTIAIIMGATVLSSDVSSFYSTLGSTATGESFTTISVNGGPIPASQTADALEATADVEWASAIAPGAKIRLYAIPSLSTTSIQAACTQILADATANNITVVTVSAGQPEGTLTNSTVQSESQVFAQMDAAGITVLFASGDGGSNPNTNGINGYNSSNPLEVAYPASDPNVTGVGGTALILTSNAFSYAGENAYGGYTSGVLVQATGGGISQFFPRPNWQTDGGGPVLTNANRCVPDVSMVWSVLIQPSNTYTRALVVSQGSDAPFGGTSLSVQIWGGIAALLNQARATAGLNSLGLLGPLVYPLHGTSSFNDITTGTNGAYSAGPGYDLCTGIGSPSVANLVAALAPANATTPSITSQPQSTKVTTGSTISLSVAATGGGFLTYQWSQNGTPIFGATSATYSIASATAANAGSYTVVVSNVIGTATSTTATVTINNSPPPPASGGGGAPSYWFYLALTILFAIRKVFGARTRSIEL
jgi:kumamolisin